MTLTNEHRANAASLAVTMYALKKEGHNHYDTRANMFADMIADVCHALRQEGEEPQDVIQMAMRHFRAEEAEEKLGQEYVL